MAIVVGGGALSFSHYSRYRPLLCALGALALVALTPVSAHADGPPTVGVLQGFTVLGKGSNHLQGDQDRIPAGGPLRLAIAGSGSCSLRVELRRGDSLMFTRTVEAALPFNYVSDFAMPPYAYKHEDFLVKVIPVTTQKPTRICAGPTYSTTVTAVCNYHACNSTLPTSPAKPNGSASVPDGAGNGKPNLGSGGLELPPPPKPANGTITAMSVPGGSFAEDDTQKIQISGSGGCALDLHVTNKSYGGNFDKTFSVNPMNLTVSPLLFNGTHFDTLAEGSYAADVLGKGGCSGKAAVDFKVTARSLQGKVNGKPSVTLDKQPLSSGVFTASKDSNIWFRVDVPSSFKSVPYVSCCEIEFDYRNSYGGWEVSTTDPVSDPGFNPLTNNNQPAPRSVSYFRVPNEAAMEWRMRVRGYRYKYAFEWSDWLEFKVNQR